MSRRILVSTGLMMRRIHQSRVCCGEWPRRHHHHRTKPLTPATPPAAVAAENNRRRQLSTCCPRVEQRFGFRRYHSKAKDLCRWPRHSWRQQYGVRFSTATSSTQTEDDSVSNRELNIRSWSKKTLSETTQFYQMKEIVEDIALRLERQAGLLQDLQNMTDAIGRYYDSNSNSMQRPPGLDEVLETTQKSLHNSQFLHRDTIRQCHTLIQALPDPPINGQSPPDLPPPLLVRQLGQTFKEIYARHSMTIESMAEIVIDMRPILRELPLSALGTTKDDDTRPLLQEFLPIVEAFLKSRLMTQLLCDHVVDCTMNTHRKRTGAIGVNLSLRNLVNAAISEAIHLVDAHYVDPPPAIHVLNDDEDEIEATIVRPWLQYALVEILKNALAITVERDICHCPECQSPADDDEKQFCPIYIRIEETESHILIHVMDQGGGLTWNPGKAVSIDTPKEDIDDTPLKSLEWEFADCQSKWDRMDDQRTYAMVRSPIRGLGVGLAMSEWQLRQFGGELSLVDRPTPMNAVAHASVSDKALPESTVVPEILQPGVTATVCLVKDFERDEADIW